MRIKFAFLVLYCCLGVGCSPGPHHAEQYAQIEAIFDRDGSIAGAKVIGIGQDDGTGVVSVDLLSPSGQQVKAERLWPGVRFRAVLGAWKS